jgi:hypothetical protein
MVEVERAQGAWRWHAGALALYAALAVGFIDHGVSVTRYIAGQGSDPYAFIWFMAWWPWALAHHVNPFFTTLVWQPVGVALSWVTAVPLLALVGTPVTLLGGPVLTYNLFIIVAPVLSAWFAYRLCLWVTADPAAALVGGFLFGFSSYEMAQDTAALNLSFTAFLPALLWVLLLRMEDRIKRGRTVLLSSLILVCQFLTSIEIFAFIFVFGGFAWLLAVLYMLERRAVLWRLFVDGLIATPFVVVVLLPLFWQMFLHHGTVHLPGLWPYYYAADVLNVIEPGRDGFFQIFSSSATGGGQEQDAYIGLPLLLIVLLFAKSQWRILKGRFLVIMFLLLLVASFGPVLWVGGYYSGVTLPWIVFMHVPLLSSALPARFALFVSLATAIIAALWLAMPGTKQVRGLRLGLGVLACIALAPRPHPWMNIPKSAFFEPGYVQQVLGQKPRILILPFAINGPSSFWQQENHFGFTQTGGYLGFPPAPMQHFAAVGELFGNFMGPHFLADFITFCTTTKTQYIVIGPGAKPEMVSALMTLDWPAKKIDDVTVLTVPNS